MSESNHFWTTFLHHLFQKFLLFFLLAPLKLFYPILRSWIRHFYSVWQRHRQFYCLRRYFGQNLYTRLRVRFIFLCLLTKFDLNFWCFSSLLFFAPLLYLIKTFLCSEDKEYTFENLLSNLIRSSFIWIFTVERSTLIVGLIHFFNSLLKYCVFLLGLQEQFLAMLIDSIIWVAFYFAFKGLFDGDKSFFKLAKVGFYLACWHFLDILVHIYLFFVENGKSILFPNMLD